MVLEMPERIPFFEAVAHAEHFPLISKVTGLDVGEGSSFEVKTLATHRFIEAWDYGIMNGALIHRAEFGEYHTRMAGSTTRGTKIEAGRPLFEDPEDVLNFDPWVTFGEKDRGELLRRFNEHYAAKCRQYPDLVNVTGVYVTLITGLTILFGWEMLLTACGLDPERFGELTDRYASWILQYYEAMAESDVPVIWSHDDIVWSAGAFLDPAWYRRFVFPNYKKLWAPLRDAGKRIIYVCDGDYSEFVDDVVAAGAHGFYLEPFTDMEYIAERYGRSHVFIGNADTRILLSGGPEEIRGEVRRCIGVGKNCPGFFFSVGNMIPKNTPVENALVMFDEFERLRRR